MDYEKMTLDELGEMSFSDMTDRYMEAEEKMSEEELDLFDYVADKIDDLPVTELQKSCDELNEFFGAHDDVKITENIKEALFWFKVTDGYINAEADMLEDIADDDEDEE